MSGADEIRAAAAELGIRVDPVSPELGRGKARTAVRKQLAPGALRQLMDRTGATAPTILRALGCDPKRRVGRPAHERGTSTLHLDTAQVVRWLMSVARIPGMPGEASEVLERVAIGIDQGDCAADRNPYTGEKFQR